MPSGAAARLSRPSCVDATPRASAAGGQVDPTLFTDKVIEQAIEQATKDARAGGAAGKRSVGDHAPCSSMFDAGTQSAVMAIEGPTISKYNLGSCCS